MALLVLQNSGRVNSRSSSASLELNRPDEGRGRSTFFGSKSTMKDTLCVFNRTRESFLSLSVTLADTHLGRLKGLLGKVSLKSDEGLWTIPSQGIHTLFLMFPIDLVYLDENNAVVHIVENLGTFRMSPIRRDSASVLQLPTRTVFSSNTQVGDQLVVCLAHEIEQYCSPPQPRQKSVES